MATLDDGLALHLPLDEIELDEKGNGCANDESKSDNDGNVYGSRKLVPDELFGSCFDFDGAADFVELKDPFQNGADFTVAVWMNPAALDVSDPRGVIGFKDDAGRKPSLSLAPSGGLAYDSADASQNPFGSVLANFFTSPGVWVHVAWVKEGAQYRFYRGGVLFATESAPQQFYTNAATAYWVGRADDCATPECRAKHFWKGQLAHARVYTRALTAEEINRLMLDDQTATAAFKKAHPIEFSLYDDDEQPVLVISDDPTARRLHADLTNSSASAIVLAQPSSPTPAPDNYHFELRFRPGTLSLPTLTLLGLAAPPKDQGTTTPAQNTTTPAQGVGSQALASPLKAMAALAAAQGDGWKVTRAQNPDGTVSIYFLNASGKTLQPGENISLTLPNVGAEAGGGARGTRVELRYSQLSYAGETAQLSGSRMQHLEIVNERGKRNVPLHVGFLGSNRVLNDGRTQNDLWLRLTNTLRDDSVRLTPSTSAEPSTFIVSFDVQGDGEQRDWALGTAADLQNVSLDVFRRPDPFEADGLELHLPFESGDAPAADQSANKNNGAVNGNPSFLTDDLLGGCLQFDGNDFVEAGDPFKNTDSFTISVWANPDVLNDGNYHGLLGHQNSSDPRKPGLWLAPSDGGLHYDSYDAAHNRYNNIIPNFFTKAGEWVHVAWVKEGAQYTFYRDGEQVGTGPAPAQFQRNASEKFWIGKVDTSWRGRLAHARVYSRALSQDDLKKVRDADQLMIKDRTWTAVSENQGESPQWVLTTTKTALAPGEIVQLKVWGLVSSLPSGQANLYVRYENLPGYWDGQFVLNAEKSPVVYVGQNVGIGTTSPRSALDTGLGVLTGAANDYLKAQATLTGGGTVSWKAEPNDRAGRLKWTQNFVAVSMGGGRESFADGRVVIQPPSGDIPAAQVWDGKPRLGSPDGLLLRGWEALYAEHAVGRGEAAVTFHIVLYTSPFVAPSNWLLIALRNDDDQTLKLGTGVCLSLNSSSTKGSPVPVGTIMMWSGDENNIPDGWVLCNGHNSVQGLRVPDLTGRFVVGAGQGGDPTYAAGQFAEADQHAHDIKFPPYTFATTQNGDHNHAPPGDWYDRDLLGDVSALGREYHNGIDRGSPSVKSVRTSTDGNHTHNLTVSLPRLSSEQPSPQPPKVDQSPMTGSTAKPALPPDGAHRWQNRPRWFALCYIMKV